jgi:hypothetical protein
LKCLLKFIGTPLRAFHNAFAETGFLAFDPAFAFIKAFRKVGQGRAEFPGFTALGMRRVATTLHGGDVLFKQR